jgi:uncharacterized membrane protein YhaH (DUF805 family)
VREKLWNRLSSFDGRVGRAQYLLTGTILVLLKYIIDTFIASRHGIAWAITNYLLPSRSVSLLNPGVFNVSFYATFWAVAIPFFWIGISLTVRRLRDAGQRLGWMFLFFVPVLNLALFLYLSLAPSTLVPDPPPLPISPDGPRSTPHSRLWGVAVAAALGLALVLLGADFLARYAWGLFLGVPFVTGFVASWFLNAPVLQSRRTTVGVCSVVPILIGLLLVGSRQEGLVCLAMAVPLAVPFSIAGGLVAYRCLQGPRPSLNSPRVTACVAIVPLFLFAEQAANIQPPVLPVVTSIVIHAPASVVWKNVIAFSPLPPPKEWVFRTGIAYPLGATIRGSGVGAVRYCRFSTGDFVEPITIWDEDHLLAFNVAAEPPSLREIGFGEISTPHITGNYMRSQHGQFRLVGLDSTHTLLEGTTWYQDYFWPQAYWRPISDAIVHRIHDRVLEHIREQAEAEVSLEK